MVWTRVRSFVVASVVLLAGLLASCGGSTTPSPSPSGGSAPKVVSVAVSPGSVAISTDLGQPAQFTANVAGTTDTSVTWAVDGVAGGNATVGTISADGVYTPPAGDTAQVVTVTATSAADTTKSSSASVVLVPPGRVSVTQNPLVAQYSITSPTDANVAIQFGPDTNYGLETWTQPVPTGGGTLKMLVAGMRANTTYHLRASVQFASGVQYYDEDQTFTTGALPAGLPSISTSTTPGMIPNGGIELLDFASEGGPAPSVLATDLTGNVIWYLDGQGPPGTGPNPIKFLPDGNMLINYSIGIQAGTDSLLEEVDLAGNPVWQMTAADLNQALAAAGYNLTVIGTHHDVTALPNGHLIVIAGSTRNFTDLPGYPGTIQVTGDVLIDLDQNRKPVWVWNEFDHLDINRHPMSFPDWTHTNAVIYSPSDGDLIVSIRHQHWLVKVDYQNGMGTGDIVWKLGWQGDFALKGGTDPVDWFYAQHGPSIIGSISSGLFQLTLFDNGNNRVLDPAGTICGTSVACYSTAPVFTIDETTKTATITGRDDLQPAYSFYGGNSEVLTNGDLEFDECAPTLSPPTAEILEVTQGFNPQTVWQMNITGQNAYRGFRLPSLYPGVQW